MNTKDFHRNTPPVIRVFLSSTFADMEHERSYFNEVIVPKLSRACAERGVSFFSVDLRWGITEEEQVNGQVLPICLGEIDKCRPYFVGILGNRYGSVLESVPEGLATSIPWLVGKEGHSITELEMLYAVLDNEKNDEVKNCAFYFRSKALSDEWYKDGEQENDRLQILKKRIREDEEIPQAQYSSLEEFGECITRDILGWLDKEFPASDKVHQVRRQWYDNELLRGYIENLELNSFLNSYVSQSDRPLLIHGDGARGKTTFLTAWNPLDGEKILINCGSDDVYLYWPSIAKELVSKINEIDSSCGYPDMKNCEASMMMELMSRMHSHNKPNAQEESYFVTDQEREAFRNSFMNWLRNLSTDKRIYIVINDLNLLEDDNSRLLSWLPFSSCGNIRLICSTNDDDMVQHAEILGWNCKEMPVFEKHYGQEFINSYLHTYGKNLSNTQLDMLLDSIVTAYPGQLRFVADFLINYGRFENLDTIICDLSMCREICEVYQYIYKFLTQGFSEREMRLVRNIFGLLRCAQISLKEQECYLLAISSEQVTAMEWAKVISVFEQFDLVKGDYWNLRDEELQKFVDALLSQEEVMNIQEILGDYMLQQLKEDKHELEQLRRIRENTTYAKACLHHYEECKNWDKLCQVLCEREVLYYLTKVDWYTIRVAWMKIFLNTEIDIPKKLFSLIEEYRSVNREKQIIAIYVASLFEDLEFRNYLSEVKQLVGTTQCPGSLHVLSAEILTDKFQNIYQMLVRLKNARQYRRVYDFAEEIMSQSNGFNMMEQCQVLSLKAESAMRLQMNKEALETTGQYYTIAVKSGYISEMQKALLMRGETLYYCGHYKEAENVIKSHILYSVQLGDLRAYLSAGNVLGMCLYRDNQYLAAVEQFNSLLNYWEKVGNTRECASIITNKANAYYCGKEIQRAITVLEEFLRKIEQDASLADVRVSILNNIGGYLTELGEYAKAEECLLEVIAGAKRCGQESSLLKAQLSLTKVYEQTDRYIKAAELYEEQMETFWLRRDYGQVMYALNEAVKILLTHNYEFRAKQLQNTWKARFAEMEGGKEFFENQTKSIVVDAVEIDRLKEQIAIAKSENDKLKMADVYDELARRISISDVQLCIDSFLEASKLYYEIGEISKGRLSKERALARTFDKGHIVDQGLYDKVVAAITETGLKDIADIWMHMGSYSERNVGVADREFDQLLDDLLYWLKEGEEFILYCLLDVVKPVITYCDAKSLKMIGERLPESVRKEWENGLSDAMIENEQRDLSLLKQDYLSPTADKLLSQYEKYVEILCEINPMGAAAIAGNIALIFRRRKEKEKTLYYHGLSQRLYKERNMMYDSLVELANMATAYREFGDKTRGIETLRQGLIEAEVAKEARQQAVFAGNLAAYLVEERNPEHREEIMKCFAIEETFFRTSDLERELVISLINQSVYLHGIGDIQGLKPKVEEAGRLIRKNSFKEFERIVANFESVVSNVENELNSTKNNQEEVVKYFEELLEVSGKYNLIHLEKRDIDYHGVGAPKEEDKMFVEQLHILIDPSKINQIVMIFLYQPRLLGKNNEQNIVEYVKWWNSQGQYSLEYDGQRHLLQATCVVRAADWKGILQRSEVYYKLCETDKMNFMALNLDLIDLSVCQGKKLSVLHEV